MIIPVITSITREVMAQTPRDACEAALALGGTRWGMITDVVLPFSRSGMVGATLLGLSRALGETIALLLILSSNTTFLTGHIMGPEGTTVAKEIGENFVNSSTQGQSELVLAGLALFATTLVFSLGGRIVVEPGAGPKAMSLHRARGDNRGAPPVAPAGPSGHGGSDRGRRRDSLTARRSSW